ncbi:MAG: hypothetical protein RML32_04090 [Gammaproteobacteria bacterium]|nr:hypothetical protein [Gammaproteobacteria bacterium]
MTARWQNNATTTAFAAESVIFAVLVEMQFASGTVRVFNGSGEIIYNGQTYSGIGEYGSISSITERPDARDIHSVTLQLAGDDATMQAKVTDRDEYFGRACIVHVAPFNQQTLQPIAVEPAVFHGLMDVLTLQRSEGQITMQLTVRHHMSLWAQTTPAYYTHEYQRTIDSSDNGLSLVHTVTTRQIYWGGSRVLTGGAATGGLGRTFEPRQRE